MSVLHFGSNAELTLPDETLVAKCGSVTGNAVTDVSQAVRDALKSPDGYPDLASMTIPEDRVAIVLETGLAHASEIVAGIVAELLDAHPIEPEHIVVVRNKLDAAHSEMSPLRALPETLQGSIEYVVHDPTDREMLSYLGPSADETLVYVNRQIADADVVIPVGMGTHRDALGCIGVHGIVVPFFCDAELHNKFLIPKSSLSEKENEKRRAEAHEIAWMLGIRLIVQVVMGDGNSVVQVLAGVARGDRNEQPPDL